MYLQFADGLRSNPHQSLKLFSFKLMLPPFPITHLVSTYLLFLLLHHHIYQLNHQSSMSFWASNKYGYGTEREQFRRLGNIEQNECWADPNIYFTTTHIT